MDLHIESRVFHVFINLQASVPLSELNALTVPLHNLDNEVQDGESTTMGIPLMPCLIVVSEIKLELLIQEFQSFLRDENVVFDCLQEEPWCISGVESGVVATVVEIW